MNKKNYILGVFITLILAAILLLSVIFFNQNKTISDLEKKNSELNQKILVSSTSSSLITINQNNPLKSLPSQSTLASTSDKVSDLCLNKAINDEDQFNSFLIYLPKNTSSNQLPQLTSTNRYFQSKLDPDFQTLNCLLNGPLSSETDINNNLKAPFSLSGESNCGNKDFEINTLENNKVLVIKFCKDIVGFEAYSGISGGNLKNQALAIESIYRTFVPIRGHEKVEIKDKNNQCYEADSGNSHNSCII